MKKLFVLANRNMKEIIREPISLVFCLGFPIIMLVLLSAIFTTIPDIPSNFAIQSYSVGICVFGFTFVMLFSANLIAGDKNTEFMNRIDMAPIHKSTYYFSFVLACLPITIIQTIIFFAFALLFGLNFSVNILLAILYLIPSALFYISLGILIGIICKNEKQTGPFSSILISIATILGGVFMPIHEMGTLSNIANVLPFVHSVDIASGVFTNNLGCIYPHILFVLGYTILIWIIILLIARFRKK